jgi:hypothetical protein
MRPDEWPPVAQRLEAAYPSFTNDANTQAVYLDVLGDVDAAAVDRAVGEVLREGREQPPPPGVLRARALGQQPVAETPPTDTRDRGARRGLGWVGVLVAIALGLGIAALIVGIANNNEDDSPTVTQTEVQIERSGSEPSSSEPSEPSTPEQPVPAPEESSPSAAPSDETSTTP